MPDANSSDGGAGHTNKTLRGGIGNNDTVVGEQLLHTVGLSIPTSTPDVVEMWRAYVLEALAALDDAVAALVASLGVCFGSDEESEGKDGEDAREHG